MRIMTVRQLVVKMTKELARTHGMHAGQHAHPMVSEEDRASARMALRLAEVAFPKTKDYLQFMDLNGFLHDVAAERRST